MTARVISCPICLELTDKWVTSEEYWCPKCEEVFPVRINSVKWWYWFEKKFRHVL